MPKKATIKINTNAKEKLDQIKKNERFSTFGIAIETMCSFFEVNKISPKDGINQNFQNSIFNVEKSVKMGLSELKKQYNKDSQSMRKLMRAIEKDHMISTSRKISFLYDIQKEKTVQKAVENSIDSILDSSKNDNTKDNEIEVLKDVIEEKNLEINRLNHLENSDTNLVSQLEDKLNTIFQRYELEKSAFGKEKIVIDMDRKDFEALFGIKSD